MGDIPGATAFHSRGWAAVLAAAYGHVPAYLALGAPERPSAVFPLMSVRSRLTGSRGVCLPFADFCAPLLKPDVRLPEFWEAVWATGRAEAWRHVEWRGPAPLDGAQPAATYRAHVLDLRPGREGVARGLDSAVRRTVRKAEAGGVQVRFGAGESDVEEYYRLHCMTRQRHGLPPQPSLFFRKIREHMLGEGRGFIALASAPRPDGSGLPVAGAVFFRFGRHAIFKFGASDLRRQELRAVNLVMWRSIVRCIELGAEELHLGRTDMSQEGLRRFKLSWGAREEPLHYYRYGLADGSWLRSRDLVSGWHNPVFRCLPRAVNRRLGALLYRHLD